MNDDPSFETEAESSAESDPMPIPDPEGWTIPEWDEFAGNDA